MNAIFRNNISTIPCFIGYSKTEHEFNIHYKRMGECGEVYSNWLNEIPREKSVQAYDSGHRGGSHDHESSRMYELCAKGGSQSSHHCISLSNLLPVS